MTAYERGIRANFRRNFIVNTADFSLWSLGMAMITTSTVLPLYLRHLTDNPVIIGLIPSLQFLGWRLPQLFTPALTQSMPRKKPYVFWMALHERVPFLLLGLFIIWGGAAPRTLALSVVLLLLMWQALGGGMIANPWQEMAAKICLPTHWGLYFGVANAMGALLGVGGAALSNRLLSGFAYPLDFGYSYLIAFGFTMLSWFSLIWLVEPAKAPTRPPQSFGQYMRRLPEILRADHNFRRFILIRWLSMFGGMGSGFMAVHAVERFRLGDEAAAMFTAAALVSMAVLNPLLGRLGDRRSHKAVLTLGFWLQAAAMLASAVAPSVGAFLVAFALRGAVEAAFMSSGSSILFEFCRDEDRAAYIGLGNTLTAPPLILAPLVGGAIAAALGYTIVFWLSVAMGAIAAVVWMRVLRDPRQHYFGGIEAGRLASPESIA